MADATVSLALFTLSTNRLPSELARPITVTIASTPLPSTQSRVCKSITTSCGQAACLGLDHQALDDSTFDVAANRFD